MIFFDYSLYFGMPCFPRQESTMALATANLKEINHKYSNMQKKLPDINIYYIFIRFSFHFPRHHRFFLTY